MGNRITLGKVKDKKDIKGMEENKKCRYSTKYSKIYRRRGK